MLKKLETTLFFIFLILIPFQVRIFVGSMINEWNSFFVYLGDIILFLVFVLFLNRIKKTRIIPNLKFWLLLAFIVIAFISIFISSATKISFFRWIKLVEFVFLFVYVVLNIKTSNIKHQTILKIIFYSGVFQAILAIAQFIKNGSIGIKFIEAGVFDPNLPGVANFILNGERIMRSYGSFSHPNVLAGFLLLAIFCGYKILISNFKFQISNQILISKIQKFVLLMSLPILIFGLFLTFSRTAIMVFIFGSLAMFLFEFFRLRRQEHTEQRLKDGKTLIKLFSLFLVSCVLVIVVLFPCIKARFFTISMQEQAVDLRFFYNEMAIKMIKEKPVLGIGIGNFVHYSQNYPEYIKAATKMSGENQNQVPEWIYQPVHNIYLLIASEIGILGLLMLLGFVGWNITGRGKDTCFLFLISCFLIISLADHYFWTLQAGGTMFWLGLALMFPKEIK
jgi:O-antigen ligase